MKILARADMVTMEKAAVEKYGADFDNLMESAGAAIADRLMARFTSPAAVTVLCGRGNNGGDGLVCARYLARGGWKVHVVLIGAGNELKDLPLRNYAKAVRNNVTVTELGNENMWKEIHSGILDVPVVIDALCGIGLKGNVRGLTAVMIRDLEQSPAFIVSADIPSGLDSDSGKPLGAAIRADMTVTMGLPKPGLVRSPGNDHAGQLVIADVGFPAEAVRSSKQVAQFVTGKDIHLAARHFGAHKGTSGRVLAIAGSRLYSGACSLVCKGALRAGAGLVHAAGPEKVIGNWRDVPPEVILHGMAEKSGRLAVEASDDILRLAKEAGAVVIGPGLGVSDQTAAITRRLLEAGLPEPVIMDADALVILARNRTILKAHKANLVLTPHVGEMAVLMDISVKNVLEDTWAVARQAAERFNAVVLLKGPNTVIASPSGALYVNSTGNPGMATGGMGDVLAGATGALCAGGMSALDAACAGAYIHGAAGDLAKEKIGPRGFTASEVAGFIPAAIGQLTART